MATLPGLDATGVLHRSGLPVVRRLESDQSLLDPDGEDVFVDLSGGDAFDDGDGVIAFGVVGWVGPGAAVAGDELQRAELADALVAIGQRMVVDPPGRQHGGLARQVGGELHPAEGRGWGVQRRFGEVHSGHSGAILSGDVEDRFGDEQEAGEVEVLDGHSASQAVEDLLVVGDRLTEPFTELLVVAPLLDAYGDRLADLLGDRHPVDLRDRFELGSLIVVEAHGESLGHNEPPRRVHRASRCTMRHGNFLALAGRRGLGGCRSCAVRAVTGSHCRE